MNITLVGLGLNGAVTAACLAEIGHDVTVFDTDPARRAHFAGGAMELAEPGLADMISVGLRRQRLTIATSLAAALARSEAVILSSDDRAPDTLIGLAKLCAPNLADRMLVILSGTLALGVSDAIEADLKAALVDRHVEVVANPGFARAGRAVADTLQADRIVIGSDNSAARRLCGRIYRPLYRDDIPIIYASRRSAEMIAHASQAYAAIKQSFVADLARLAAAAGASLSEVARGIDLDRRIGSHLLDGETDGDETNGPRDVLALLQMVRYVPGAGSIPSQHEARRSA